MKKYVLYVLLMLLSISCSRQKEIQKSAAELNSVPVNAETEEKEPGEEAIVELEEKLVEVEEEPPAEFRYFVIIGSFRIKDNAIQYQETIGDKGFSPVLLRNEAGLYRVSVKATDKYIILIRVLLNQLAYSFFNQLIDHFIGICNCIFLKNYFLHNFKSWIGDFSIK